MITQQSANIVSTSHLSDVVIEANAQRSYLMIIFGAEAGKIKLGGGTGEIPLAADTYFEPRVCPTGKIEIVNAGTYTVVMG